MFSFFLIIFIFVENLLIAAGIVIDEKLPVTQKAVDLSKRNLGSNPLHFSEPFSCKYSHAESEPQQFGRDT